MKALSLRTPAAALLVLGLGISAARAITYSIDIPSPSSGPFGGGANLHNPPPLGPLPPLIGGNPPAAEVDGFSYGIARPVGEIYFSVSRASVGAAGSAVFVQSSFGDQPADIYVTSLASPGTNALVYDGNGVGVPTGPSLGLIEPMGAFPPGDNVDGLDLSLAPVVLPGLGPSIFWSVDPATAALYPPGSSAADIFWSPAIPGYAAGPGVYAPAGLIGLLAGADDIDGLVYMEDGIAGPTAGDTIFFSLTPGSATLAILGYAPGTGGADVFVTSPGGAPALFAPAGALGLLATDNIDALDIIPEPSQLALLGLGALGCMIRRRRA